MSGAGTWREGKLTAYVRLTGRADVLLTACCRIAAEQATLQGCPNPMELHLVIHLTEVWLLIRMRWSFLSLFYG